MIRILLVDDHPALRAGLTAVLRAEPGLVPLGTAPATRRSCGPRSTAPSPTSWILDYHVPPADGLQLCRRMKRLDPRAEGAALQRLRRRVSGHPVDARGRRRRGEQGRPRQRALRRDPHVARGDRVIPPLSRELLDDANARLDSADLPILGDGPWTATPEERDRPDARPQRRRDDPPHGPDDLDG